MAEALARLMEEKAQRGESPAPADSAVRICGPCCECGGPCCLCHCHEVPADPRAVWDGTQHVVVVGGGPPVQTPDEPTARHADDTFEGNMFG
jgi:hypothetical protein